MDIAPYELRNQDYLGGNMIKAIVTIFISVALLMNVSCAKTQFEPDLTHHTGDLPIWFPDLYLDADSVLVSGIDNAEYAIQLKNDIYNGVSFYFHRYENIKYNKNVVRIVSIKVAIEEPNDSALLPLSLISTVMFPLAFARQPRTVSYCVDYSFLDETRHRLYERRMRGSLYGRFLGYSFTRYAFYENLKEMQKQQLSYGISGLIIDDLLKNIIQADWTG